MGCRCAKAIVPISLIALFLALPSYSECSNSSSPPISWRQAARKAGSDRASHHAYQHMYEKYLRKLRFQSIALLEVGQWGCDAPVNVFPGMEIWYSYIANKDATIDFLVENTTCADKLKPLARPSTHVFVGPQSSKEVLQEVYARAMKPPLSGYDVIIDDGDHNMASQRKTFEGLWNALKPKGIYFIEDVHSSYMSQHGGGPMWTKGTTIEMIKIYLDLLNCDASNTTCTPGVQSVDCFRHACAFVKSIK